METLAKYLVIIEQSGNEIWVDVEGTDLAYTDIHTHCGGQCNYSGEHENFEKIQSLCANIVATFKEIYMLNKEQNPDRSVATKDHPC